MTRKRVRCNRAFLHHLRVSQQSGAKRLRKCYRLSLFKRRFTGAACLELRLRLPERQHGLEAREGPEQRCH